MMVLLLLAAAVLSSSAAADSCVTLEGHTLSNKCKACMEVTIRQLRPPDEQATTMFASGPRVVRVEAGGQTAVENGEQSAIVDLKACP
jgi:hypothetical protein